MQYFQNLNTLKLHGDIRKSFKHNVNRLAIKDTAEFPLAFNVEMPAGNDYKYGNFSFLFRDFNCNAISEEDVSINKCVIKDNKLLLGVKLNAIRISGKYSINAKEAPFMDMDTAGNMMELKDREAFSEAAGEDGGDNGTAIDPAKQDEYLDNARAQRDRLMDTPNGQTMMAAYNEHNEVYNEIFNKSADARSAWYADGATGQMADDTHNAVLGNQVVNPESKMYSGDVTFNENAFLQQLNIATNALYIDPDFDWDNKQPPDPNSKYTKASQATYTFNDTVNYTGNTNEQVTELTSEQVYGHVENSNYQPSQITVEELHNVIKQGTSDAGADEAAEKGWNVLNEKQRKWVRRWFFSALKQKVSKENFVSVPVWTGECEAYLENMEAEVEVSLEPSLAAVTTTDTRLNLPAFEFSIRDAQWTGKAAEIVRERLSQIFFIKSLIHSQIEKGLRDMFQLTVKQALGL